MSTKVLFKVMIPLALLVVVFLAVQVVSKTSASSPANAITLRSLVGSDWIERHPGRLGSDYYAGSDWFERHQPVLKEASNLTGSDWIERHSSNPYDGSDWIERHLNR